LAATILIVDAGGQVRSRSNVVGSALAKLNRGEEVAQKERLYV